MSTDKGVIIYQCAGCGRTTAADAPAPAGTLSLGEGIDLCAPCTKVFTLDLMETLDLPSMASMPVDVRVFVWVSRHIITKTPHAAEFLGAVIGRKRSPSTGCGGNDEKEAL